jgi:integrase
MSTALVPIPDDSPRELALATLADSARRYVQKAKAPRTLKAYDSDWADFERFCQWHRFERLPARPETIGLYLSWLADAGRKPATLSRRLAAISKRHAACGLDSPTAMRHACVKEVWDGIRRDKGTAQTQKAPAVTDYLKRMLEQVPSSLIGIRDRAMLLNGFAAALRRAELVALEVEDISFVPEGLILTIRRSKTDQNAVGEKIAIHSGQTLNTCPVRALKDWLTAADIRSGPIFRPVNRYGRIRPQALTDQVVALSVKRYAEAAGLDSSLFSGHSLRAGLATSAAIAGANERRIQDQTRHKSVAMVRRYIRDGSLFRDNVTAVIGL